METQLRSYDVAWEVLGTRSTSIGEEKVWIDSFKVLGIEDLWRGDGRVFKRFSSPTVEGRLWSWGGKGSNGNSAP
jgi:hypothetical protein